MSLLTPRMGLSVPETTDSMVGTPALLSGNYDKIDLNFDFRTVTNLVDVTTPFEGMLVFESSSGFHFIRVNSQWNRLDINESGVRQKRLVGKSIVSGPFDLYYPSVGANYVFLTSISFPANLIKKYIFEYQLAIYDGYYAWNGSIWTRIVASNTGSVAYSDPTLELHGAWSGQPLGVGYPNGTPCNQSYSFEYQGDNSKRTFGLYLSADNDVNSNIHISEVAFFIYEWSD